MDYGRPGQIHGKSLGRRTRAHSPRANAAQNSMSAILAGISGGFCLIVLGIIAYLSRIEECRKAMDRLSFRLLIYALISE